MKNILGKYFWLLFVILYFATQDSIAADDVKRLPGSISVYLEPFGDELLPNGEPRYFRILPRYPNGPTNEKYTDFKTQPFAQGNLSYFLGSYIHPGFLRTLGFRSEDGKRNGNIIIPHAVTLKEKLELINLGSRIHLVSGLIGYKEYLEIIASGAVPLALPNDNESYNSFVHKKYHKTHGDINLKYHAMVHDLFFHAIPQIIFPQEWVDIASQRAKFLLEIINRLEKTSQNMNEPSKSIFLYFIQKFKESAVGSLDVAHGNVGYNIYEAPPQSIITNIDVFLNHYVQNGLVWQISTLLEPIAIYAKKNYDTEIGLNVKMFFDTEIRSLAQEIELNANFKKNVNLQIDSHKLFQLCTHIKMQQIIDKFGELSFSVK